jgi:hypothetical protein
LFGQVLSRLKRESRWLSMLLLCSQDTRAGSYHFYPIVRILFLLLLRRKNFAGRAIAERGDAARAGKAAIGHIGRNVIFFPFRELTLGYGAMWSIERAAFAGLRICKGAAGLGVVTGLQNAGWKRGGGSIG